MKTKVKNNGKFPKFLLNCIVIFFLIGFGIILLSLLFNNLVLFEQFNIFSILLSLIIYSCYIFIVYKILDRMKFLRRKYFWIFMLFYILLQIIAIIFLTVEPGWDFKIVFEFAAGSNPDIMYFYQFQNNALFAYILKAFLYPFKLIGVQNLLIPAMVFNAFLYDVGLVFLYKIIVNFFNPKIKKLSVYLLFSTLPYLLHVPIVYTDSSVFALSSIITYYSFYFILHKFPASTFTFLDWKDIVRAIALGLSTGLIIYIKTPIFILFIALTIILCFKKYCLRTFKYLSFSVLAIALVMLLNNIFISQKFDKAILNQNQIPPTHWVMMALKGVGNYDGEDYKNTALAGDYQQKIAYHKTEIVNRLKNHIKSGDFALFYANKYTYMWGDGTFYATGVLSNPVNRNILHEFILPGGQYFTSFAYITQASYLFIFLLMFFSPFLTRQKRNLPYYFLLLVMVGYFLFFSVWEVASRQLIYIYPIMLLIASYSLQSLASNIKLIKFNQQIFTKIHQCFHIHHKKLHKS